MDTTIGTQGRLLGACTRPLGYVRIIRHGDPLLFSSLLFSSLLFSSLLFSSLLFSSLLCSSLLCSSLHLILKTRCKNNEQMLAEALRNMRRFLFLGVTERYKESVALLSHTLHFDPSKYPYKFVSLPRSGLPCPVPLSRGGGAPFPGSAPPPSSSSLPAFPSSLFSYFFFLSPSLLSYLVFPLHF
jgi:hypothetical protein